MCRVTDGEGISAVGDGDQDAFGRVEVQLDHLGLIPVQKEASFTIKVAGGDDAELAVSVQGKMCKTYSKLDIKVNLYFRFLINLSNFHESVG